MINLSRIAAHTVAAIVTVGAATAGVLGVAAPNADAATRAPTATIHDIKISVEPLHTGTAGSSYLDLVYRNRSTHTVALTGWSGLSLVGHGNGTQLGKPARWLTQPRAHRVLLKPGQSSRQVVAVANPGDFGSTRHHTARADGFRVYLPGSSSAVFVPFHLTASTRNVTQLQEEPIGAHS